MNTRLLFRMFIRIFITLTVVMGLWAVGFYFMITVEVSDETNAMLENSADDILYHFNKGMPIETEMNGMMNSFYMEPIPMEQAIQKPPAVYKNTSLFIESAQEKVPVRLLEQVVKDANDNYYLLSVYTASALRSELLRSVMFGMVYLYIGLLGILTAVCVLVFKNSLKPIVALTEWLKNFSVDVDFVPYESKTKTQEYQNLNVTVNTTLRRTRARFVQNNHFIMHLSHDMVNSISDCQKTVQRLLDNSLPSQQSVSLNNMANTLSHIAVLNASIYNIVDTSNDGVTEFEKINLRDIVHQVVNKIKENFAIKKIRVVYKTDEEVQKELDPRLARLILVKLIYNAFHYNIMEGEIDIQLTDSFFSICNRSDNGELDYKSLFSKYKTNNYYDNDKQLDLSMLVAICRTNNMDISYLYENEMHCFKIIF